MPTAMLPASPANVMSNKLSSALRKARVIRCFVDLPRSLWFISLSISDYNDRLYVKRAKASRWRGALLLSFHHLNRPSNTVVSDVCCLRTYVHVDAVFFVVPAVNNPLVITVSGWLAGSWSDLRV